MSNLEIRKTIVVDAPTDVVFRALTDEKELVKWLPQEAKMDARVGGQLQFQYRREGRANELVFEGEVLELVQDRKVSYTYHFSKVNPGQAAGPAPNTVVTWTLDGLPDGRTRGSLWSILASLRDSPSMPKRDGSTTYPFSLSTAAALSSPARDADSDYSKDEDNLKDAVKKGLPSSFGAQDRSQGIGSRYFDLR